MRNIRFVPGVMIFTLSLCLSVPVLAQQETTNCRDKQGAIDSIGKQDLSAKDQWVAQLRYRDASGGTACCFDQRSGIHCDDFSSIRYCEEGFDPQLNVPKMWDENVCPEYFGDEEIDAPLHLAVMIGAHFVGFMAERDSRLD